MEVSLSIRARLGLYDDDVSGEHDLWQQALDHHEAGNLERPEIVALLTALLEKYEHQGYSRPMRQK